MKRIYKILFLLVTACFVSSCEEGDVFTGTPVGTNLQFETLQGTITTSETHVVSAQTIPITVTIPKSFPVDTKVQATAFLPNNGKRSTKSIDIPAGQTTVESTMQVPGADQSDLTFNSVLEIYLTGFTTGDEVDTHGFPGKQYSMTSDKITLDYGDAALPALNPNRLIVRLDWEFPNNGNPSNNNLNLSFRKNNNITTVAPNSNTSAAVFGTQTGTGRYETININNAVAEDATYTINVFAAKLKTTPSDIKYRFIVRFPNDTTKVFYGVLSGITVGNAASSIPKLQIVKVTDGNGAVEYTVTQL
jgi:hypothetical protein